MEDEKEREREREGGGEGLRWGREGESECVVYSFKRL